ncbi:formyl transferase [Sphingomonas humi]|uniref:Formyl transferase N-terminal domain-containing protein n=1 Tax=Sphingomonas humi TaxID=335630 RepID=A0ABP7RRB8_9SPHN
MRLILLTGTSPEGEIQHRHVAQRLAEAYPDALKAIIVATGVQRSLPEKVRRWRKRLSNREIASRLLVRGVHQLTSEAAAKQADLERVLFPAGDPQKMPRQDLVRNVASHNSPECRALVAELKPDIAVVYGTLVIGKALIQALPRTLNLHTGQSPRYRGSDTNFWPIYNREPQYLGSTVHLLDPGIDSGAILARGRAAIEPVETVHSLFGKAVAVGAELLCRAVGRVHDGLAEPQPQDLSQGREYRSVERSWAAERRVKQLIAGGILGKGLPAWREEF